MSKRKPSHSKIAVCYCIHDDVYYLADSIDSFRAAGEVLVLVSRTPWEGDPGDWEGAAAIARQAGAEVVIGAWAREHEQRNAALQTLAQRGYAYAVIADGDEIIEPGLLQALLQVAQAHLAERVYVQMDTYWHSVEYVIRPREQLTPVVLVQVGAAWFVRGRGVAEEGRGLLLGASHGVLHHLSYVGPAERIRRKLATFSHSREIRPGWYERLWRGWETDKLLRNLHPTHPEAYGWVERIPVPPVLAAAGAVCQRLTGEGGPRTPLPVPPGWPPVSGVIPLHGGEEEIRACLESLSRCQDLLVGGVVLENASPDGAGEVAARFPFVRVIRNATNRGYPAACNQGLHATKGEVVLFLNSDTVVPRAGLIRLIEALIRSGSVGAAGPYTNCSGHFQQITPTYTTLDNLERFAEDFAERAAADEETDMLVGFALAVKRSVLQEVGEWDERFGIGMFDDNDLSFRIRRAGYRLVIAARSFVHHEGSRTFARTGLSAERLLGHNRRVYEAKWRADLESGFASQLSGLGPGRVGFDPAKHPEARERQLRAKARQADISLCLIVKNEERVIGECLDSARLFFKEIIVVDTGSTDRTIEIAREMGAKVVEFPWTDSFAEARNESLKYAKGRWVFWMDADDTLPWQTGEALLEAALAAPPDVVGYVVPVQFVEDGSPAGGTRVDHLKLFRNRPGLAFEGRIHEQILPSLRATGGGQIVRLEGAGVLHSGYDTSPEGQAKKRERDLKLLHLDLQDRPDHPFVRFNLGMTYHYMGEYEQAVEWLEKCLAVSPPEESHVRKAYALLAVSQRELGQTEACLKTLEQGLALTPEDPELHFHAAHVLTAEGRYEEAKAHYQQVLAGDIAGHYASLDMGILGYKTYHNLGGVCMALDRYEEARHWWRKALEAAPGFLPSAFELFRAALKVRDYPTACKALDRVQAVEGLSENWARMGQEYTTAMGDEAEGVAFLRQVVRDHPGEVGPRLVLARWLLNHGQEGEAHEHLAVLEQQGVAEAAYYLGVAATRRGDLERALSWMERAQALNPEHEPTREQIANLKQALGQAASQEDAPEEPEQGETDKQESEEG